MTHQRWVLHTLLMGLACIGGLTHPPASAATAQGTAASLGHHPLVRVEGGMVSVHSAGVALDEILRAIRSQSQIRLVLEGARPETIFAEFHAVPLDQALRRLIRTNFLLLYGPGGRVLEVRVLGLGTPAAPPSPAARALGPRRRAGEGESPDALIAALHSSEAEARGMAVLALGEVKEVRALELVIGVLQADEDPEVRRRAIWALEDLGDPRAIEVLAAAAAEDNNEAVRQRAVEAVAKMGGDEAVEPLAHSLQDDPDRSVRYEALVHLAERRDDRVLDLLRQALADPEELIRAKAAELLEEIERAS